MRGLLVLLSLWLISAGCAFFGVGAGWIRLPVPARSPAQEAGQAAQIPTGSNVTADIPVNRQDLTSVMAYMDYIIEWKQPALAANLIGPGGMGLSGPEQPGYNNSQAVTLQLSETLASADPVCLGYSPSYGGDPDLAAIYFRSLPVHWSESGSPSSDPALAVFYLALDEEDWALAGISPIGPKQLPNLGELISCPRWDRWGVPQF